MPLGIRDIVTGVDAVGSLYPAISKAYAQWSNRYAPGGGARPYRGSLRIAKKARRAYARACRPEMHYLDVAAALTAIPAAGACVCINQIAEGNEFNTRTARNIVLRYIQYQINLLPPTTAGVNDQYLIAIVYDRQSNGVAATYGSIFDQTTHAVSMEFKNIAQFGQRFRILRTFRGSVSEGTPDLCKVLKGVIKIPPALCRITYAGSAAAIPETGAIYACYASWNNTGVAATSTRFSASYRIGFNDC